MQWIVYEVSSHTLGDSFAETETDPMTHTIQFATVLISWPKEGLEQV